MSIQPKSPHRHSDKLLPTLNEWGTPNLALIIKYNKTAFRRLFSKNKHYEKLTSDENRKRTKAPPRKGLAQLIRLIFKMLLSLIRLNHSDTEASAKSIISIFLSLTA
ncbi:hypothetical protein XC_2420 [Xanthomonas campestris pv. campestris str. 8004]|uniref:Uncharacterized protein n=1 Tax=Xanthomonas campestris pv. campestris (strain 8004) TaxID=314565 RepID=A0A0H2X873_XANC8|nr:hypothetical protein XC_2420 [Xanthomonas campestris pv. campestris str. 8004]